MKIVLDTVQDLLYEKEYRETIYIIYKEKNYNYLYTIDNINNYVQFINIIKL